MLPGLWDSHSQVVGMPQPDLETMATTQTITAAAQLICNHSFSILCDGVPEVLRIARLNRRQNAKLIKVCASGGVMSEVDHPMHQKFSDEELGAIVAEARRHRDGHQSARRPIGVG